MINNPYYTFGTMSVSIYTGNPMYYVYAKYDWLYDTNGAPDLRTTILLKDEVTVTGDGTKVNPYVIS